MSFAGADGALSPHDVHRRAELIHGQLARVHGTSELPASLVALLLCTCRRWSRVTAGLIAAIEDSRLLTDADLDELAESCLVHDYVISYRLAWVSPQRLEIDVRAGTSRWPVLKLALPSPLRPGWVSDLIVGVLAAEHLAELVGRVECRTPPPTGNASPRRR